MLIVTSRIFIGDFKTILTNIFTVTVVLHVLVAA